MEPKKLEPKKLEPRTRRVESIDDSPSMPTSYPEAGARGKLQKTE